MITEAFGLLDTLRRVRERAGMLLLGLDFDGTLAPIVPTPAAAALPVDTRTVLDALARRADTRVALVSGRGLEDLAGRVDIASVFYAGNHGLEIEGPGVHRVHPEAAAARDVLAGALRAIAGEVDAVDGVIVEDKGLTASVHYRLVADDAAAARVRQAVHRCCEGIPGLRVTDGRKVVELRPDVDWHKGRALLFLRDALGAAPAATVFIGDDRTDEDAFRLLAHDGYGIVVGNPPPLDTAATAALSDTAAVADFLRALL